MGSGWLLVPVNITRASYAPAIFLLGVLACFGLTFLLVRKLYHGRLRRVPAAVGPPGAVTAASRNSTRNSDGLARAKSR